MKPKITVVETNDGDWAVQLPKGRIVVDILSEVDSDNRNYRQLANALARIVDDAMESSSNGVPGESFTHIITLGNAIKKATK